jgi:hypothetical protein
LLRFSLQSGAYEHESCACSRDPGEKCGLGAFVDKLTFTSIVVSTLLYLSYGLSRILSMAIDGMPAEGLVQAAALEIVIGLVCVFVFVKYRDNQKQCA